jgi:beta-phosphoglucomutase-like phosphatase (HAD superfamily)
MPSNPAPPVDVLQRVLQRIANPAQRPPVAVFDLDGTLYDSRYRTLQILTEYAEAVRDDLPDVSVALDGLRHDDVSYLLADTLRGGGIVDADTVQSIMRFWRERFFADEYLKYDHRVAGAVDFVRTCHQVGATVVYLAGRDAMSMLGATAAALFEHGFPMGVAGVELLCKHDPSFSDEAYKRVAMPSLKRIGEVVTVFDNEPANCNVALKTYPNALIVCLDTQHVPGAPELDAGVVTIRGFARE